MVGIGDSRMTMIHSAAQSGPSVQARLSVFPPPEYVRLWNMLSYG